MSVTSIRLPDNFQLPAAATQAISLPASPGETQILPQSQPSRIQPQPARPNTQQVITKPGIGAANVWPATAAWQTVPVTQPQSRAGFGSPQLARPQLVTPQFMTLQPTPASTGVTTGVSSPVPTSLQPAAR
jgi:hypothetical protein